MLLIHGWGDDASVWNGWIEELNNVWIYAEAVTFGVDDPYYDACGSSSDHATDLNQIVEDFRSRTDAEKINLVTHSKGGLDARVYLDNNDLLPGSEATRADIFTKTKYYTIASDWTSDYAFLFSPYDTNCPAPLCWFAYNEWGIVVFQQWARDQLISGPDDGLVPSNHYDIQTIVIQVCSQMKSLIRHY